MLKKFLMIMGCGIAAEILFAAFEQKDCRVKPEQKLIKDFLIPAPKKVNKK